MSRTTQQMPTHGYAVKYSYDDATKAKIIEILKPYLIEECTEELENAIIDEVESATSILNESAKGGFPAPYSIKDLKQLKKTYDHFRAELERVNENVCEELDMLFDEDRSTLEYIESVMLENRKLIGRISCIEDYLEKNRPKDVIMHSTIVKLYVAYHRYTGKKVAVGGILQRFLETAIAPIDPITKSGITHYLRQMQNTE